MTSAINQLKTFGQSFWFDNIQRSMIHNGELQRMIDEDDLRGITSNPSIFEKAINGSTDYDNSLTQLVLEQPTLGGRDYFYQLAIEDIQNAANLLLPVYEQSDALDGYVSIEVSPDLAYDTQGTVNEALELFAKIGKPNVMIKVPATKEGIPAVEQLIAHGINVNATLLFSPKRYAEIAHAYIRGLEMRAQKGHDIKHVASVASFFVSRVDTLFDEEVGQKIGQCDADMRTKLEHLRGNIGILNAKCAYLKYQKIYAEQFESLDASGARPQRLLWASTGVKNPQWSDVLYIDSLVGENTVNTIPPATLTAFKDHGRAEATLAQDIDQAIDQFGLLSQAGIDVDAGMQTLEDQGVAAFAQAFENLVQAIEAKATSIKQQQDSSAA